MKKYTFLSTLFLAAAVYLMPVSFLPATAYAAAVTTNDYCLYVGTTDKDTQKPVKDADKIANQICLDMAGGYTMFEAQGGWVDDHGKVFKERTLVYVLKNVSDADVHKIMDKMLKALDQECILVEKRLDQSEFYYGPKQ